MSYKGEYGLGSCHIIWEKKKELLRDEGVYWKSPDEMNPDVIFD